MEVTNDEVRDSHAPFRGPQLLAILVLRNEGSVYKPFPKFSSHSAEQHVEDYGYQSKLKRPLPEG